IKILLGLVGLYLLATFSVISLILPEILGQIDKGRANYVVLSYGLIYYIAFDVLVRYFIQKLGALDLQKFMLTPLKKSTIFHFSLWSSVFNIYNLLGWILLLPFGFRVIMPQLGTLVGFNWLISIGLVPVIS